jgi:signal transduction histidine kinase/CheY-like chemotaxis protein
MTGVCWDITERRAFEAQLRKSEQTLAATLTSIHEGVAIVDADGKLVYLNPMAEQILDMTIADKPADQWPAHYGVFSVDGETPVPPVQAPLLRALRGEQVRDIEIFIRNTALPDGAYLSVNAGPLRDKDGVSLGAVASFRDISHRRSLEEERARTAEIELRSRQADESNRLKSEFLANMSHELRTPLNGIIGFAELLHDGKAGPVNPDQKEYLGDVLTSGQHLLQLINDVLDLAKVESGKMEFRPEPVDLTRLVAEVRDILRTLAAQKRIDVMTEIDPTLGSVTLDPAKLKQVLYNFLSNAIKFTPDAGRVVIRAVAEADDQFRIEVEDTGIGIRPEDYPRLFVEFQQLDTTSAKKYQGTGLGLALTKRIVTAQSGRVGVQSSPGQGSTFFAVLPRVSVQETAPAVAPPFQAHSSSSSGPLILVVEDEPADRDLITRVLIEQGYRVESASTGQAALERCQAQVYAAITLDILLPDASGRDILKAMRAGGPNQDTPVILVTAVAENGVAAGFEVADILVKPVSAAELVSALKRAGADPGSPRPILVVDDDPNALKLAEKVLREIGFRTRGVTNGAAALEVARTDSPAAIILDLRMPFMDGFEFLRRLRQTPEGRRVPVIVWTVQDLGPEERATLIAAAQAVVQKGDSVSALIEEIRNHVRMAPPSPPSADRRVIGGT